LTAARTNETLGAKWDEINIDEKVWTVPAARMKGGHAHRIPLSDRAVEILQYLPRMNDYVFPALSNASLLTHLSSKAMVRLLQRMGYSNRQRSTASGPPSVIGLRSAPTRPITLLKWR
jgi:integrase